MDDDAGFSGVHLRWKIKSALQAQGFVVGKDRIELPESCSKATLRELNRLAVEHTRQKSKPGLQNKEQHLVQHIANGNEVDPASVNPKLITVTRHSEEELLFRYVRLHWSIPVSAGYGRRLRFLVVDESNDKLIGIIGLCDPVFALKAREEWVGWTAEQKKDRLYHVMDAFVLGAVPPYNQLLFGKLIAMLVTATEVQEAYKYRYAGTTSLISGKQREPLLALVSTASALGKSSVYNRLKAGGRQFMYSVGFTKGSGDFQFYNGVYTDLFRFVKNNCEPSAKRGEWGSGFRNKREIIKKGLKSIGLPSQFGYHNISREIFLSPLARNSCEFLRGETDTLDCFNLSASDIYALFKERWLNRRATHHAGYQAYSRNDYLLWDKKVK